MEAEAARLATVTLMGQAMVVRQCRAAVLRLVGTAAIDAESIAALKAQIDANVDAILDRMAAEEQQ